MNVDLVISGYQQANSRRKIFGLWYLKKLALTWREVLLRILAAGFVIYEWLGGIQNIKVNLSLIMLEFVQANSYGCS